MRCLFLEAFTHITDMWWHQCQQSEEWRDFRADCRLSLLILWRQTLYPFIKTVRIGLAGLVKFSPKNHKLCNHPFLFSVFCRLATYKLCRDLNVKIKWTAQISDLAWLLWSAFYKSLGWKIMQIFAAIFITSEHPIIAFS